MQMGTQSMTEAEREDFLADLHVGVLSIERRERAPLTVPIWYRYEPGGLLHILIGPDSLKARLLAKAGRFSLCVQSEVVPYRYVSVEGNIVETRQVDREADARVMARRYLGKVLGDQYIEDGDDESMICVSMRPERWYSVDYGKVG
jgi:nitroimidazol reductase NimA-like FMN-containing flavoprotein (pyridoxamine 5'-phosphate oxidase superfamily)